MTKIGLVAVLLFAVSACTGSAPPEEVEISLGRQLSDDEVRVNLLFEFFESVSVLDPDGLDRAMCDDYASESQISEMIERLAELEKSDRVTSLNALNDDLSVDPVMLEIEIEEASAVVSISITRDGIRCISDISSTDDAVGKYLTPS